MVYIRKKEMKLSAKKLGVKTIYFQNISTRTLKDTVVNASGAGGTVTVLVNWDDENSSNNNVLDASGLDGHANGAKLHIKKLWWQVNGGVADDDKNWFFLEFKSRYEQAGEARVITNRAFFRKYK